MEHIDQNAVIGYGVPLRITFSHGEMVVERDVREEHRHTLGQCDISEECELRYLHQGMRRTRITHPRGPQPRARYAFGVAVDALDVRVLLQPKRYEVLVADQHAFCSTCFGVMYHDIRRTRDAIDLERVTATLANNTLEVSLPRQMLVTPPRVLPQDWPGPGDLGK